MTYLKYRSRKGESTELISARVQIQHVEYSENNSFVFGRFINSALETFIHDLQTEYNIKNEVYWLTYSGRYLTGYETDGRGSVQKMIRIRADLLQYLRMNKYKVNTAINLACDRWKKYREQGNVADWKILEITNVRERDNIRIRKP